jgi:hypothetical protein
MADNDKSQIANKQCESFELHQSPHARQAVSALRAESNWSPVKPTRCWLHMYFQRLFPHQTQLRG